MGAPQSSKRKRHSTDSTNTDLPSVFDDGSLLPSPESPTSDNDGHESGFEAKASQVQPNVSTDAREAIVASFVHDYATLASKRSPRKRISKVNYFDSYKEIDEETSEEPQAFQSPTVESEQITAQVEEEYQSAPIQNQTPKRKKRSQTAKVTSQPPQKRPKRNTAKNSLKPEVDQASTTANHEPRVTPPSQQSRKRKLATPLPATEQSSSPKEPRTTPTKTDTKAKPRCALANSVEDTQQLRRNTQPIIQPKKLIEADDDVPSLISKSRPKLVIKLRDNPKVESFLRSQSGTQSERHSADVSSNTEAASRTNSATTSFNSTSTQLTKEIVEQYAQSTQAPVPASSQDVESLDDSQTNHPEHLLLGASFVVPNSPQGLATYDLNAISAIRFTPPSLENGDTSATPSILEQVSQQHPSKNANEIEQHQPPPTTEFEPTQATLPWNNSLNPPSPTSSTLSELSATPVYTPSSVAPNADTEDEEKFGLPSTSDLRQLYDIAEKLFANRKPGMAKPAPAGQPEVWADGRQELCETLHYFRAYQSACYCTAGFARGFMFDKVAHARDYIDRNVVISRAGGGLIKHKDSGEMRSRVDQSENTPVVTGLKNCMNQYNPVVVITGIDNPHIPSPPPHQYCVLDYFKPTHIWTEKSGNSKILRYRFEKLNPEKDSWWRPEDEEDIVKLGSLDSPIERTCAGCGTSSTQIYLNGWMCLQPSCDGFWHIADDPSLEPYEPDEESLVYDPRFLKSRTRWPNDQHDYALGSNGPELSGHSIPGENTSQAYWSGIVCPNCGRCNSRINWMGWECMNPICSFKRDPPHTLISAASLREPFWPVTASYTMSRDTHDPLVNVSVSFAHGYRINRYSIPGLDGFITHMVANKTVLEEPSGPDAMFEELQQTDINLRRRPMPNGQLKGESYCRHFTVNYGMPYKFIAATASHSFAHAAQPITATRSRLNWAAQYLLAQETGKSMEEVSEIWKPTEFNEVLALGYFESQKINYHDDGEFGLGPTIATLSLGAPGTMRIRMKARHYHGASTAGVYDDARPLPGCQHYEQRLALQPGLEALRARDAKAWRGRMKEVPRELGIRTGGNARDVLRMEVGHGDVVVMHGSEVQRYYEHAVEHAGKLRFALTCRYIDEGSLGEGDRLGYVVGGDEGGYDGAKLC